MSLLRHLLDGVLGLAATRLEWWALAVELERRRLVRRAISAAVALGLLFLAMMLAVVWLMLWVDPAQRLPLAGALALGFSGGAALAAWRWYALGPPKVSQPCYPLRSPHKDDRRG